jgi:hypothetical protein
VGTRIIQGIVQSEIEEHSLVAPGETIYIVIYCPVDGIKPGVIAAGWTTASR